MSNRQARREQMRTTRQQRAQRPSGGGGRPSRPSGGGGGDGGGITGLLRQPFAWLAAALVVALAVVLGFLIANRESDSDALAGKLEAAEQAFPYDLAKGNKVGKDDAPLKLVQFEDFQCPFCLRYTANQEPALVAEFVKTGKLQIEYKHLPGLGPESVKAAKAAVCAAEQDKFWQFQNRLFVTQAKAGQSDNEKVNIGRFDDDKLKAMARDLGLDGNKFDGCYDSEDSLAKVQADDREAKSVGINGTPGFRLNNAALGSGAPADIDGWRKILNDQLNATPTPARSPTGSPSAAASATAASTPTPAAATATPTR